MEVFSLSDASHRHKGMQQVLEDFCVVFLMCMYVEWKVTIKNVS